MQKRRCDLHISSVTISNLLYLLLPSFFSVVDEMIRSVTLANFELCFRPSSCDNVCAHSFRDLYGGETDYIDERSQSNPQRVAIRK